MTTQRDTHINHLNVSRVMPESKAFTQT